MSSFLPLSLSISVLSDLISSGNVVALNVDNLEIVLSSLFTTTL
jgi:hypothetical protein